MTDRLRAEPGAGKLDILVVEDNDTEAFLVQEALQELYTGQARITRASRLDEALQVLQATPVDVALLDLGLPDGFGLGTLLRVREVAPDAAIVVVTALDDESLGLEAVSLGAQDYLVKGELTRPKMLLRSVRYAMERKRSELKLAQAHRKLQGKHNEIQSFYHTLSPCHTNSKVH